MLKHDFNLLQKTNLDNNFSMSINPTVGQKPTVIINSNLLIVYANDIAQTNFGITNNSAIYSIKADPEFFELLRNIFEEQRYLNINLFLNIENSNDKELNDYSVEIEKIRIDSLQLLLITFTPKRNQQLLESNINSIHSAIDYADIPIMILDKSGKISFITRAMEKLVGLNIEELYGKSFCHTLKNYLSNSELLEAERAIIEKRPWIKVITLRFDHKIFYKELQLKPFTNSILDEDLFVLIATDISDYIYKNLIIKESENKLKAIINNISDPILILKVNNKKIFFESANNSFFKVFDFQKDLLLKNDIRKLFINDYLKLIVNNIDRLIHNHLDMVEFISNYKEIYYNCKISKMDISSEEDTFLLINLIDITEHEKVKIKITEAYKKEQQLNKLKTSFLANMSHEIRTPLNAVNGYSELFEECLKTNDFNTIAELTTLVKDVLSRISNLFDQIIDMSEIEAGELVFDYVHLDASKVLLSVYNKLNQKAEKKNIKLELDISDDVSFIKIDWIKLQKVVYSLVENAIKFTASGKVVIRFFEYQKEVHITIIDTGEGMNPEDIKFLVEPFSQEELGYTKHNEGAGLGLAIASRLTQLMGGRFEITSKKGAGTKVNLAFPISEK